MRFHPGSIIKISKMPDDTKRWMIKSIDDNNYICDYSSNNCNDWIVKNIVVTEDSFYGCELDFEIMCLNKFNADLKELLK